MTATLAIAASAALSAGCGGDEPANTAGAGGQAAGATSGTGPGAGGAGGAGGGGGGGAGSGGAPEACDRAGSTRTAPTALFDALVADLEGGADVAATTDAFVTAVAEAGGTPLVDPASERVVFVWRGAPDGAVTGSWADWAPGAVALAKVGDSDLHAGEATLPTGERHEYKVVVGETFLEDRLARNVAWDGIDHAGPGEMNGVVRPQAGDATRGRLVAWRDVPGAATDDTRDVFVYLPAAYDAGDCAAFPVIEVHDGNESLTRVPFQDAADATYLEAPAAAAVLVFVALHAQEERVSEYTFGAGTEGDAYVTFLRDELRPYEAARLRACTAAADRGIAGASLGGLISAYAAFQSPEAWGFVGSQSGSFFWEDAALVERAAADPVVAVRWYVDHGCPEDNCESNRDLVAALESRGYAVSHVEEPDGAHDWAFWQKRLPGLLRSFRDGAVGCR
ncbi:MAG: alpha/beta hydrolase-fold protein [Polyangiaceae bacterium]